MTAVGTTTTGTEPVTGTGPGTGTNWYKRAGITGPIFGVMLAAAVFTTAGAPDPKNAAKVQAWVDKHTGLLGFSSLILVLTVVVGLYFLMWVRSQLDRPASWMGNVFLAGALMFGVAGTVSAGLHIALSDFAKHLGQGSIQLVAAMDQDLNYPMTCAGLALMYIAAGSLIRRSGILPGWLAWVSWVFALTAASVVLGFISLVGTVLWVIVVGILLTTRAHAAES